MKNEQEVLFLNSSIADCIRIRAETKGMQFGVELELEGDNVAMAGKAVKGWRQEADGSLRGESIEWVFAKPCEYKEAVSRVTRLFDQFKENKVVFKNSYRTSTHVHLNFCDKKVRDVVNFFCVFTVLEELLEIYCGEGREGNLFCLPSRDVEGIVNVLEDALLKNFNFRDFNNDLRYCAANLCSLNKFGTVEIRTMRGADNADMVLDWMNVLRQVYIFATEKMESPARFIESLSFLGIEGFLAQVFDKETTANLLAAWGKRDIRTSLFEGVRLIQVLAYRIDEVYAIPAPIAPPVPPKKNWKDHFIELPNGRFRHIISDLDIDINTLIRWAAGKHFMPGEVGYEKPKARMRTVYSNARDAVFHVPSDPEHEDPCPGIDSIWYDEEEGLWFDENHEEYLEWRD